MNRLYRILTSSLLGAAVFAFWMWLFPQDLSYQEQNQLFLFTWDYLGQRLALPGGPADWLSEFLVQFFYSRTAGALIMALLAILLQRLVWRAAKTSSKRDERSLYVLSFIPSLLMLVYQGDVEVLLSYPVALILAVALCPAMTGARWNRLWLIPLGWWLTGPVILVPILLSCIRSRRWEDLVILFYTGVVFFAGYRLLAAQYPARDAFFGLNYYRLVESLPVLQIVIPAVTLLTIWLCGLNIRLSKPLVPGIITFIALALGTFAGVRMTYDKDTHETLAYDWLIRHERYADVITRAEKYQPHNPVSACSVNFCLFMNGQLESRLTEFYQCGTEGLVLPSIRDNLSDITSAELLWMMGMPNITLQYVFDVQESIQNGRKSGRFLSRIAECNIVNGWYDRAEKYLDILSQSLFYRKWARSRKAMIQDESLVAADPVYAYIRSVRFQDDFVTFYDGLDLMMAILYNQNKNNFMAAQYYTVWQRLKQTEAGQ
ncbi:MAG: hypothetical protein IJP77_09955 [Bacteroidales bacterium]|nr:hypothetical protein [Bacteroidales bacterium]